MLLLVTGASGVGKSTARIAAVALLDDSFDAVELWHLGPIPAVPTKEWRHRMVEIVARRAIDLDAHGRHLLLAGDPIAAGEVLAAPSAEAIDVAVCLLDADAERLRHLHHGYAAWMRNHAVDPTYVPEAVTDDGWPEVRWERWVGRDLGARWAMTVIDTSHRPAPDVGALVADWCRRAVAGQAPTFRRGWSSDTVAERP